MFHSVLLERLSLLYQVMDACVGSRVQGSGFGVSGLRFRVQGLGFRVEGLKFRGWGLRFQIQGAG